MVCLGDIRVNALYKGDVDNDDDDDDNNNNNFIIRNNNSNYIHKILHYTPTQKVVV